MHRPHPTYQVDGAAIRSLRMSRGQATAALASQAGISRSYLTQLEIGIRERMRPPAYTALRTALGLAPDDEQLLAKSEGRKPDEVT